MFWSNKHNYTYLLFLFIFYNLLAPICIICLFHDCKVFACVLFMNFLEEMQWFPTLPSLVNVLKFLWWFLLLLVIGNCGDHYRNVCIIYLSQHMVQILLVLLCVEWKLSLLELGTDAKGNIDIEKLRKPVKTHKDNLSALMLQLASYRILNIL